MEFSNAMDIRKAWKLKHKLIAESILKNGDYDHEQINQQVRDAMRKDNTGMVTEQRSRVMESNRQAS